MGKRKYGQYGDGTGIDEWGGRDGTDRRPNCDVGSGAWVLIKCNIPVSNDIKPQTYGIYWATPAADKYGRQKVKVYTPHEVCLLNHEYTVISDERLKEYIEDGYYLNDYSNSVNMPLNREILERGRSLCEEEKEIIMALMLDGLTEQEACEEYFYTHHTDNSKNGYCYLPTKELLEVIVAWFGKNGIAG